MRKSISTSERRAEHPFAGGNTQHVYCHVHFISCLQDRNIRTLFKELISGAKYGSMHIHAASVMQVMFFLLR